MTVALAHAPRAAALASWRDGMAYGLLGLPLASVGALLMLVRLLDAVADTLLGRLSDRLYRHSVRAVLWVAGASAVVQVLGLAGLFFPPVEGPQALAVWMVAGLLVTCLAHSQVVIAHQAWGVQLGGDSVQRSRIVA